MCDELKSGGSDNGDDVLTAVVGWAAEVVSSVVAGFERIGREEQECDATLKTNIYCTAPSPQHTHPAGTDEPSAASALGSAGDGDDAGGENGSDDGGGDGGDGGGGGSSGLGGGGGSSVAAGFERIGREEQECDATLKTNIYCTAPSPQHTRPGGADEPSAASALGSAGDGDDAGGENGGDGGGGDGGDDARQRESDRGPDRHTYSYATMSVSKRKQRGKKKKAQTVTGGGEAGAAAQSASS
jgi:hypothetical protein